MLLESSFAGGLRVYAIAHFLYDREGKTAFHDIFPDAGSCSTANFRISIQSRTDDWGIADTTGHL